MDRATHNDSRGGDGKGISSTNRTVVSWQDLAPQSGHVSNFGVLPTASDKCGFSTDSSTCGCLSTRLEPKRSTRLHSSSFSDQTPGLIFVKLEPKHDLHRPSGGQDPPLALSRLSRKW